MSFIIVRFIIIKKLYSWKFYKLEDYLIYKAVRMNNYIISEWI